MMDDSQHANMLDLSMQAPLMTCTGKETSSHGARALLSPLETRSGWKTQFRAQDAFTTDFAAVPLWYVMNAFHSGRMTDHGVELTNYPWVQVETCRVTMISKLTVWVLVRLTQLAESVGDDALDLGMDDRQAILQSLDLLVGEVWLA